MSHFKLFCGFTVWAVINQGCLLASEQSLLGSCGTPEEHITMHLDKEFHNTNGVGFCLNRTLTSFSSFARPIPGDFSVKLVNIDFFDECAYFYHNDHTSTLHALGNRCGLTGVAFDGNNNNGYGVLAGVGVGEKGLYPGSLFVIKLWLWDAHARRLDLLHKRELKIEQIAQYPQAQLVTCLLHKDQNRIAYAVYHYPDGFPDDPGITLLHIVDFKKDEHEGVEWQARERAALSLPGWIFDFVHVGNDIYFGASRNGLLRIQLKDDYTLSCQEAKPIYVDERGEKTAPFAARMLKLAVDESSKLSNGIRRAIACYVLDTKAKSGVYTLELDEHGYAEEIRLNKASNNCDQLFYNKGVIAAGLIGTESAANNKCALKVWLK